MPATPSSTRRAPLMQTLVQALVLAGLGSHLAAAANATLPGGLTVVQGQAGVSVQGTQMTVTNSAGALLNWQRFSIGAQAGVHFQQPDATSRVLNRVAGNDPSQILGRLTSNGEVWLLNPNGVLFGRDARVDVRSLVVSTLNLGNDDWRAGRLRLGGEGGGAAIVNQGELRSTSGGRVLLVAGAGGVRNEGLIVAPDGQVTLAAGRSADLVDSGTGHVAVRVQAPQGEALNLGRIGGSRVDLAAAMVNQNGIVRAEALGGDGGLVVLSAAERASVAGTVDASGRSGSAGRGGTVQLLGREVGLLDGSTIDVSGPAGGGTVHAGGGRQGADPGLRNAEALYMGPQATLLADATARGDGGSVVLWSDRSTRAYGRLSARGGPQGGDGGFIETSGGRLDARPAAVRTDAPAGRTGLWLIDPNDLLISDQVPTADVSAGPDFQTLDDRATLSTASIVAALNQGNNVTITTANNGANTQNGDVTMVLATIDVAPPQPVSLTINATRNLGLQGVRVQSSGQPLNLTLSAANGGSSGAVGLSGVTVDTAGGNIDIGGNTRVTGPNRASTRSGAVANAVSSGIGVAIEDTTLDAGSTGTIRIVGQSTSAETSALGVRIIDGVEGFTRLLGANIELWGFADSNAPIPRAGVSISSLGGGSGVGIEARNSLTITGQAHSSVFAGGATAPAPVGVAVDNGLLIAGPAAAVGRPNLLIEGSVSDGVPVAGVNAERVGVRLGGADLLLRVGGGSGAQVIGRDAIASPGNSAAVVLAAGRNAIDFVSAGPVLIDGDSSVRLAGAYLAPGGQVLQVSGGQIELQGVGVSGTPSALQFDARDVLDASGTLAPTGGSVRLSGRLVSLGLSGPLDLSAPGPVQLFTDRLRANPAAALQSTAAGDAIVVAGFDRASNVAQLPDNFGGLGLVAPNGRWLVYAADDGFVADAPLLGLAFYRYATVYPAGAGGSGNGLLYAQAPLLTLQAAVPISKVYDGGTAAPALQGADFTLGGLRPGHRFAAPLVAPALAYATPDAGTGLAVNASAFTPPAVESSQGVPVFGYGVVSSLQGSITPRPLTLSGAGAADKVYDGTRAATLSGGTLANLVPGETLGLVYGAALFDAAGVGAQRGVTGSVALADGSGRAANYTLAPSVLVQASITPATLTYVADAVQRTRGSSLPPFSGSVTGFVAGETLAGATTGALAFTASVPPSAPAGRYAIAGGGLAAANYVFVQAAGNATALTLVDPPPPPADDRAAPNEVERVLRADRDDVRSTLPPEVPPVQRTLDALPGTRPDPGGLGQRFEPLPIDSMSWPVLGVLLEARGQYKQSLLRDAITRLEVQPGLADLPACETVQQAESGECLVTDALVASAEAGSAVTQAPAAPPVPAPAAAAPAAPPGAPPSAPPSAPPAPPPAPPPAAPVATPAAAPPVAAAASQPAAPAAPAMTAPPTAPAPAEPGAPARPRPSVQPLLQPPPLPPARTVAAATLPQIQRKLAVLVGIDNYADSSIPTLENARRDADAVARVLEGHLGYEVVLVRDASRRALVGVLNRLALTARPSDSVVVYFAGHGTVVESTGRGYWIPADADAARPQSWVANTDIERLMGSIRASQVVLIADSCFSGSLVDLRRGSLPPPADDVRQILARRAAVVMSSGGNEPVSDGGRDGHSPFAASLMRELQGLDQWRPGSNVFQRVRDEVTRRIPQTPQYGPARQGRHAQGADYLFEERQLR